MAGPVRHGPLPPDRRDLPGIQPSPARRRPPRQRVRRHRLAARWSPGDSDVTISTTGALPAAAPASAGGPHLIPPPLRADEAADPAFTAEPALWYCRPRSVPDASSTVRDSPMTY